MGEVRDHESNTWPPMQVGLDELLIRFLMSLCSWGRGICVCAFGEGLGGFSMVARRWTNRGVVTPTQSHMPAGPWGPRSQMGGRLLMGCSR